MPNCSGLLATFFTIACLPQLVAQDGDTVPADAIANRLAVYVMPTKAPPIDPVLRHIVDLTKVDFVREAVAAGRPSVLYIYDGEDALDARQRFERELIADPDLCILLRCFRCGSIDTRMAADVAQQYGRQLPLFLVIDAKGKAVVYMSMRGYKPRPLNEYLVKAAVEVIRPAPTDFVKNYRKLLKDLESALAKQKAARERLAAGADEAKSAQLRIELKALEKGIQILLEKEKKLLEKAKACEPPAGATRLGGPPAADNAKEAGKPVGPEPDRRPPDDRSCRA